MDITQKRAKSVWIEMKEIIRIVLLSINVISLILVLLFGATGVVYELFGAASYKKMLLMLRIPWSYERIWVVMLLVSLVLVITYVLRKKFFD